MTGVVLEMKMKNDEKNKALEAAIGQIGKAFGKGSVMKLGQRESAVDVQQYHRFARARYRAWHWWLSKRTIVEVYGPIFRKPHWYYTLLPKRKKGGTCAFIDAEHALDPVYGRKLGVNIDDLLISQPDAGEQALEIADTLVRSGAIDVLVVDLLPLVRVLNSKGKWVIIKRVCMHG